MKEFIVVGDLAYLPEEWEQVLKRREAFRRYREAHRERINAYAREWRAKNRGKYREYHRDWMRAYRARQAE